MKKFFHQWREEAGKRALYRRTRDEIAGLSNAEARDLGLYPHDAERIAREAVWG